jgi:hypothetical protein
LHIPYASFDHVLVAMDPCAQVFFGLVAIEILKTKSQSWSSHFALKEGKGLTISKLETEVRNRTCVLVVTETGEIERVTSLVTLRIEDAEGRVFAQIANLRDGEVTPCCMLPGSKLRDGELCIDAIERLLSCELLPFRNADIIGCLGVEEEWRHSRSYGLNTKYLRNVFKASLNIKPELESVKHVHGPAQPTGLRKYFLSGSSCGPMAPSFEVQVLTDGKEFYLAAWLMPKELEHFLSPAGEHDLVQWVSHVIVSEETLGKCAERYERDLVKMPDSHLSGGARTMCDGLLEEADDSSSLTYAC